MNINKTRSFPGAHICSNHDMVIMTFNLRLKSPKKNKYFRIKLKSIKLNIY